MKYKHVIWDWNGTLLDDVELGHSLLVYLQKKMNVTPSSFDEYRKIFTFPITDFYKRAGIYNDRESFRKMADVYIKKYNDGVKKCRLQEYARETLQKLCENNITNSILTASMESMAVSQLQTFGIIDYFIAVTGKKDYYASGKEEVVDIHLNKIEQDLKETVFIGDTLHDLDIANQIGCDCIIVLNGHQYIDGKNLNTANNLKEVADIVLYECI